MFLNFVLVVHVSWKVYLRSEDRAFYWSAFDRIKCRYAHSGMTSGVGGFQNPGVCLQAFPSFLPHPLPAYSRHFSRGLCSKTARKRLLRRLNQLQLHAQPQAENRWSQQINPTENDRTTNFENMQLPKTT